MSDAQSTHLLPGSLAPEPPAERAHDPHSGGRTHRLGTVLRESRERAGLDLSDLAEVTHVRRNYLAALEEGRYAELPEDVYTRNFLRLYAQAVRLDDEPLLELYTRERRVAVGTTTLEQRLDRDRRVARTVVSAPPSSARGRRSAAPSWLVGPWLPTMVLVALVVGIGLWGFNQFFGRTGGGAAAGGSAPTGTPAASGLAAPGAATGAATATAPAGAVASDPVAAAVETDVAGAAAGDTPLTDAAASLAAPTASLAAPSLAGAGTSATLPQVRVDVVTVPAGASITIDGFPIPGTTPLAGIPVTGREGRVVRAELDGYAPTEVVADLTRDARVDLTLTALGAPTGEGAAAAVAPAAGAAAPASAGRIQITVSETSWLEVWRSNTRNVGERLVYTTAQPGATYAFDGPVYVHVGNGAGVRVTVDGQDRGALGGPGAVLGRALP